MEEETSTVNSSSEPPPFLEVIYKKSGKRSRFAAGTKAGFAVTFINRNLVSGAPLVSHIVAVKEGEEPVNFGPDAILVDYGMSWKLQTFTLLDFPEIKQDEGVRPIPDRVPTATISKDSQRLNRSSESQSMYIGKIVVAFMLMFLLGGILTLALENLPRLILLINSSM